MSFVLLSNNRKPISGPFLGNDAVLVKALKKYVGLIRVVVFVIWRVFQSYLGAFK